MIQKVDIILSSGSPRRKELLRQAGLDFTVFVTDADESTDITDPEMLVEELSRRKCRAAVESFAAGDTVRDGENIYSVRDGAEQKDKGTLFVSADTVVALDGRIIGKPKDEKEALEILMSLSGKTHDVFTGVSCIYISPRQEKQEYTFSSRTKVVMYSFDEEEALDYIATGEPMDKAGAYGIQGIGARLVERIEGDYNNVVGFPLSAFLKYGAGKFFCFGQGEV